MNVGILLFFLAGVVLLGVVLLISLSQGITIWGQRPMREAEEPRTFKFAMAVYGSLAAVFAVGAVAALFGWYPPWLPPDSA